MIRFEISSSEWLIGRFEEFLHDAHIGTDDGSDRDYGYRDGETFRHRELNDDGGTYVYDAKSPGAGIYVQTHTHQSVYLDIFEVSTTSDIAILCSLVGDIQMWMHASEISVTYEGVKLDKVKTHGDFMDQYMDRLIGASTHILPTFLRKDAYFPGVMRDVNVEGLTLQGEHSLVRFSTYIFQCQKCDGQDENREKVLKDLHRSSTPDEEKVVDAIAFCDGMNSDKENPRKDMGLIALHRLLITKVLNGDLIAKGMDAKSRTEHLQNQRIRESLLETYKEENGLMAVLEGFGYAQLEGWGQYGGYVDEKQGNNAYANTDDEEEEVDPVAMIDDKPLTAEERREEILKFLTLSTSPEQDDIVDWLIFQTTNHEHRRNGNGKNLRADELDAEKTRYFFVAKFVNGFLLSIGNTAYDKRREQMANRELVTKLCEKYQFLEFLEELAHEDGGDVVLLSFIRYAEKPEEAEDEDEPDDEEIEDEVEEDDEDDEVLTDEEKRKATMWFLELSSTADEDDFLDTIIFHKTNKVYMQNNPEGDTLRSNMNERMRTMLLMVKFVNGYLISIAVRDRYERKKSLIDGDLVGKLMKKYTPFEFINRMDEDEVRARFIDYEFQRK